jgi:endonuclease YncB( thermonuclease family)
MEGFVCHVCKGFVVEMGGNVAVMIRRLRDALVALCMLALSLMIIAKLEKDAAIELGGPFQVVDGDTLSSHGQRLRLVGIDAPELGQRCENGDMVSYDCDLEARDGLELLIDRAAWACQGSAQDQYRRTLVRCALQGADLAEAMVRQGLVVAEGDYLSAQAEAQVAKRGLWAGRFERPADWRRARKLDEMEPAGGFMTYVSNQIGAWLNI